MALTDVGLPAAEKAKSNAEDLRLFLNSARLKAIGFGNLVVAFKPDEDFYYACITDNTDCTMAEQYEGGVAIFPMPDMGTSVGGQSVRGVKLKYSAEFGKFTQAGNPAYIAGKTLSGTVQRTSDGVYYENASGTDILSTGMSAGMLTIPSRFVFKRNGTADGGSIYLYLKRDDETSFHYAVNVDRMSKVNLYQWSKNVDDANPNDYKWKMTSTR